MDEQTLKALEHGIAKWRENCLAAHPNYVDASWNTCRLCRIYYPRLEKSLNSHCIGCPVYLFTAEKACKKTPYETACEAREEWLRNISQFGITSVEALCSKEKCLEACRREVDFLCSLLPIDHKDYKVFDYTAYLASHVDAT